jgi:hypothetical protein
MSASAACLRVVHIQEKERLAAKNAHAADDDDAEMGEEEEHEGAKAPAKARGRQKGTLLGLLGRELLHVWGLAEYGSKCHVAWNGLGTVMLQTY